LVLVLTAGGGGLADPRFGSFVLAPLVVTAYEAASG